MADVYSDEQIQQWHARSMTVAEAHSWIDGLADAWRLETAASWAVVDLQDRLLGRAGFRAINLHDGVANVAYRTATTARGNNIAARAVQAICKWMLANVGLHRIELNHSTRNIASCRVATKAGFVHEETRREQALHPDGWHDMHVHGLLERDLLI